MRNFTSDSQFLSDLRKMCEGPTIWISWLNDANRTVDRPGHYETALWKDGIWVHDPMAKLSFVEARICRDEGQSENGRTHLFITPRGEKVLGGLMTILEFYHPVDHGLLNILFRIDRVDLRENILAKSLFRDGAELTNLERIDIVLQIAQLPKKF